MGSICPAEEGANIGQLQSRRSVVNPQVIERARSEL